MNLDCGGIRNGAPKPKRSVITKVTGDYSRGKISLIILIHLTERGANQIALFGFFTVEEESAPNDLEALVGGDGLPDRLFSSEGMLDHFKSLLSCVSSDLNIGFRDRRYHHRVLAGACRFGDRGSYGWTAHFHTDRL